MVRSIDVATELYFSKPSMSVAMKNLKSRRYITVSEDGYLCLTKEGQTIAESNACKMEHDITPESYEVM